MSTSLLTRAISLANYLQVSLLQNSGSTSTTKSATDLAISTSTDVTSILANNSSPKRKITNDASLPLKKRKRRLEQ
eukprot:scaffold1230_cov201-Alexandrium_tamarense.AAC.6